jgi:hypothetical protein
VPAAVTTASGATTSRAARLAKDDRRHNRLHTVEALLGEDNVVGGNHLPRPGRHHNDISSGHMQNLRETEVYQTQRFMMRLCA